MMLRQKKTWVWAFCLLAGGASLSCSSILGFEDFSADPDPSGGDGDGDGDGDDDDGDLCESSDDCPDGLFCVNGECSSSCEASKVFCAGPVLFVCNEDGDDSVGDGEECVSAGLCEQAAEDDKDECPEPVCDLGESRCVGGPGALEGESCNLDQTGFEIVEICDSIGWQCSPATGFCFELSIDATEVTRDAYEEFIKVEVDADDQEKGCIWNESFEADADCMNEDSVCSGDDCDEHPQVCVDWCDAAAYCEWLGQRLCGSLSTGERVDFDGDYHDPGSSEWTNACSSGGQYVFTHGDDAPEKDAQACSYAGRIDTTYEVGSREDCASDAPGYSKLFDLSGNVAEWTNNCDGSVSDEENGADTACRARGGSFESKLEDIECEAVTSVAQRRSDFAPTLGFRCCD